MDLPLHVDGFISALEYLGTVAFAITGATKAVYHRADVFGIVVLATVVGVAGGITRDIAFGQLPIAFADPLYLTLTVASGVAIFFLYPRMRGLSGAWLAFDAVGLGVFSISGASIAYQLVGLDLLPMLFGGFLTAIGGGILRDVFVREMPIVFVKEVYAVASVAGIAIFYALLAAGLGAEAASLAGIAAATGIRVMAIKFKWNLPRPKP